MAETERRPRTARDRAAGNRTTKDVTATGDQPGNGPGKGTVESVPVQAPARDQAEAGRMVAPTFTLTAECFPTRIRSAGFGLVDGPAVSGGAVGVLVIASLAPRLSSLAAPLLISSFLVVAAILAQFTPHARNRALEDLSP